MLSPDLYERFHNAVAAHPFTHELIKYNWGSLPKLLPIQAMAYSTMFEEFSAAIANEINRLLNYAHELEVAATFIKGLSKTEELDFLVYYVDPKATLSLLKPKSIREKFINSATNLSHQANQFRLNYEWKDNLLENNWTDERVLKACAKHWKQYSTFESSVQAIAGKDFKVATCDFRDKYSHKFQPQIHLGISNLVSRNRIHNKVSYSFGQTDPMSLDVISALLGIQCQNCEVAFDSFKCLVGEFEYAIRQACELTEPAKLKEEAHSFVFIGPL